MDNYSYIENADPKYIENLYLEYLSNPENVSSDWKTFFAGFQLAQKYSGTTINANDEASISYLSKESNVQKLISAYRQRGHLLSTTNPIRQRKDRNPHLELADFDLTEEDLNQKFASGKQLGLEDNSSLSDIIKRLKELYSQNIGAEFMHIQNLEVRRWLMHRYEETAHNINFSVEQAKRILTKLNEAVAFESFLHKRFVGQKRFSLEGGETTIPALDCLIEKSSSLGVEEVVIGMAHRGRLNVLANTLRKTYEYIFTEFEGISDPDLTMGDGDVKYHLGFTSEIETNNGKVYVKLLPNPSHLEAVNPVVEGYCRSKANMLYNDDFNKILPVLIHGDAAISGQGIVYEVAQMSQLPGYHTGGTIHFVINNQIGFTTDWDDARSSTYCTGVAKVTDSPIFHVNGDDPESVVFAMELAIEFRQKFKRDVYIDMVCYRRHGHNESDEPKYTQPRFYELINKHPDPREVYSQILINRGKIEKDLAKQLDKEFRGMLQDRLNSTKQKPLSYQMQPQEIQWSMLKKATPDDFLQSPITAVDKEILAKIVEKLSTVPDEIKPIKKSVDELKRRKNNFEENNIPWALAELLAYGSLLLEGHNVRISGQDVVRGTFSHRHAGVFDSNTEEEYLNLAHLSEEQGRFLIYNSLLSEYAVLGFEYGYAMANPNTLTIWEAQFGDFVNGAQVSIDQFISSGESKWQRMNGLVMLLPHGYEGQGPEHSSARMERFLELSAEYNMVVANCTTPANFFHLLRRQLKWNFRKPLIVFTPKSLLRHPKVVSKIDELTDGRFQEVIADSDVEPKNVKRLVFCTGKIYYDLLERKEAEDRKDIAIIRVEQLFPMPEAAIDTEIAKYPKADLVWVQEEPKNMGAWTYWLRREKHRDFKLISRKASASPATGYAKIHAKEQQEIVSLAFYIPTNSTTKSKKQNLAS
jgi:2-oxoglutarate dehydrogenase E1 component